MRQDEEKKIYKELLYKCLNYKQKHSLCDMDLSWENNLEVTDLKEKEKKSYTELLGGKCLWNLRCIHITKSKQINNKHNQNEKTYTYTNWYMLPFDY